MPEEKSAALQDVAGMGANGAAREAIRVREIFPSYFLEEGAVPWQHLVPQATLGTTNGSSRSHPFTQLYHQLQLFNTQFLSLLLLG